MDLATAYGRRFSPCLAAVLVAGLAVAFGHGFGIGFLLDDRYAVAANPAIRSLRNLPFFFSDPSTLTVLREGVDYRPLVTASFALNHALSGLQPWSYHALNLLLHLASSWMVFVLVRDHVWWPEARRGAAGTARFPAAAAALLFALAPLNNQAVNSMDARSELLATALVLGALLAMLRSRVFAAVLLQALALLAGAPALVLPAAFVAYDLLYRDRSRHPDFASWARDWKDLVPPVLPLVLVGVAFAVQRHLLWPADPVDALAPRWVTPWVWTMTQWSALLHTARLFVWPAGLSADHDFRFTLGFAEPRAWGSLTLLAAWIWAALTASRRFPHAAFATVWFFAAMAPHWAPWPNAQAFVESRAYLASSLGLAPLAAWLLETAARYAGARRREAFVAAVLLAVAATAAIGHVRTREWSDEALLWEAALRSEPDNGRAWLRSGEVQFARGNLVEARRRYDRARRLLPVSPQVHRDLSLLEAREGNRREALAAAKQAVRFGADDASCHAALGAALAGDGQAKEAETAYAKAVKLDPRDEQARTALQRLRDAAPPAPAMPAAP